MNAAPKLKIACESNRANVSIIGSAGLAQAVALKKFYVNALLEGLDDFTIECGECSAMDSTFLGTLTGLALKLKKARGRFRTRNVRIEVLKQMASVGLSSFLAGGKKS